jgi:hypothetical protein
MLQSRYRRKLDYYLEVLESPDLIPNEALGVVMDAYRFLPGKLSLKTSKKLRELNRKLISTAHTFHGPIGRTIEELVKSYLR